MLSRVFPSRNLLRQRIRLKGTLLLRENIQNAVEAIKIGEALEKSGGSLKSTQLQEMLKDAKLEKPTVGFLNTLLGYFGKRNPTKTVELFNQFAQHGLTPDSTSYCNLIASHMDNDGYVDSVGSFYKQMVASGIEPTIEISLNMIEAFKRIDQRQTEAYFKECIERHGDSIEAYNGVIESFATFGNVFKAGYYYKKLLAHNLKPTTDTYSSMIIAFGSVDPDKAEEYFHLISRRGLKQDRKSFEAVIGVFADLQDDKVLLYYDEMVKKGIIPSEEIKKAVKLLKQER